MHDAFLHFSFCFVPMFVAVDPLGLLPVFLSVTGDLDPSRRQKVVRQAVPAAAGIGIIFFLIGGPLLKNIGIQLSDLMIAGGVILFVFAMLDLLITGKPSIKPNEVGGIVPLATPLIAGPAVLTLGLVLVEKYGYIQASLAFLANLSILFFFLAGSERFLHYVSMNTMRAISKVVMLLLAAIGVALVREGIMAVVIANTR